MKIISIAVILNIDRLLSPTNTSLTLQTLQNATSVLGKKLSIEIR